MLPVPVPLEDQDTVFMAMQPMVQLIMVYTEIPAVLLPITPVISTVTYMQPEQIQKQQVP